MKIPLRRGCRSRFITLHRHNPNTHVKDKDRYYCYRKATKLRPSLKATPWLLDTYSQTNACQLCTAGRPRSKSTKSLKRTLLYQENIDLVTCRIMNRCSWRVPHNLPGVQRAAEHRYRRRTEPRRSQYAHTHYNCAR